MLAFFGSWFIAYLLGGGLILAVILYFVFFRKHSLLSMAIAGLRKLGSHGSLEAAYS
jgi:hypothetical protein